MAYTPANYTGNGVSTDFTFTFPYILPAHVIVKVNGVATSAFTFFTSSTIRFNVAPANGAAINITRSTTNDSLPGTFQQGSAIPAAVLNANFNQNLYVNQESSLLVLDTTNLANQTIADSAAANVNAAAAVVAAGNATSVAAGAVSTANSAVSAANSAVSIANGAVGVANTASSSAGTAIGTANAAAAAVAGVTLATLVANRAALEALSPVNNTVYEVSDTTTLQASTFCQGIPGGFVGSNLLSMRLQYQSGPAKFIYQTYAAKDPLAQFAAKATETTAATGVANAATAQSAANAAQSTANATTTVANTATSNIQLLTAAQVGRVNKFLNGDFRFSLRFGNTDTADLQTTDTAFVLARWRHFSTQSNKIASQRIATNDVAGFNAFMRVRCGNTATVGSSDAFLTGQNLWGEDLLGLLWGTASAKPLYLTFKARSNLTGNFSLGVRVGTFPGPYISRTFLFNIPVANTWTDIAITIPGCITAGARGQDVKFLWSLGSGSSLTLAPGSWTAGDTTFATGANNLMGSTANQLDLMGVQVTETSLAIPFQYRTFHEESVEIATYQQYYSVYATIGYPIGFGVGHRHWFTTAFRATPTIVNTDLGGFNWNSFSLSAGPEILQFQGVVGGAANAVVLSQQINAVIID